MQILEPLINKRSYLIHNYIDGKKSQQNLLKFPKVYFFHIHAH